MDVEKLPVVAAVDLGSVEDPLRPVLSFAWNANGPHSVCGHSHPRAQIIFQRSGVYRVTTDQGDFLIPPRQAFWIPPRLFHSTYCNDSAKALMLFVDENYTGCLPAECMMLRVDDFLQQLFMRIVQLGNDYQAGSREFRLVEVMLDELAAMRKSPLSLPLATDKRLRRVMETLLLNPANTSGIEELASQCGSSGRNLARLFRSEVGMTFHEWRAQLRLLEAIERLARGESVTRVAMDLGYQSSSAFIAMFRRCLGTSPTHYPERNVKAIQGLLPDKQPLSMY